MVVKTERERERDDSFVYLSLSAAANEGSNTDIQRKIDLVQSCMKVLDCAVWLSSIFLQYLLSSDFKMLIFFPFVNRHMEWDIVLTPLSVATYAPSFMICTQYISPVYRHVHEPTNLQSLLIQQRRLKLFGHSARAVPSEDAMRMQYEHLPIWASTGRRLVDWCRPRGRPRQSWFCTIEHDLKPFGLGLHSALRLAVDHFSWQGTLWNWLGCALWVHHLMMMMMMMSKWISAVIGDSVKRLFVYVCACVCGLQTPGHPEKLKELQVDFVEGFWMDTFRNSCLWWPNA